MLAMNRDPMTFLLAAALLLGSSATAGLGYWHLQTVRLHQQAQEEVARINKNKALMQSLAAESVEYAKKNPAFLPILQSLGVRGPAAASAPAQPEK